MKQKYLQIFALVYELVVMVGIVTTVMFPCSDMILRDSFEVETGKISSQNFLFYIHHNEHLVNF